MREQIVAARSRIAMRAFRHALKLRPRGIWYAGIGLIMPKGQREQSPVYISRSVVKKIARDIPPGRIEIALARLCLRHPTSPWPSAFAAGYAMLVGDPSFGIRFLSRLHGSGAQLSTHSIALLAGLQIDAGRAGDAQRTLSLVAADAHARKDQQASDLSLLAASAWTDDDQRWTKYVNRYLACAGLSELELRPGPQKRKFTRLPIGAEVVGNRATRRPPKVTVIVSCFNAAPNLETALGSLQNQTHANLEIIAVDDCSSDDTWDRLLSLSSRDMRIRLLQNPKNVGTYVSRNRALQVSTGDYVTTQDSDDWSHPERIERQVALLERTLGAVASYCGGVRMWEDGRFELDRPGRVLLDKCHPSIMYRKSTIMERTGYWDCVRVGADSEYLERVLHICGKRSVLKCAKPLMIQLRRRNSLTSSQETRSIGGVIHDNRQEYAASAKRFLMSAGPAHARYDFERWVRPFPAPDAISVPDALVREAAAWEG